MALQEDGSDPESPERNGLLLQYGFDFASRVTHPFPSCAPLARAIVRRGFVKDNQSPLTVIERLIREEGNAESITKDGIRIRKIVDAQGNVFVEAGEAHSSVRAKHSTSANLTLGITIQSVLDAVRETMAEQGDRRNGKR
ncbi:MAG: hypothetical protein WCX29_01140 [Candidatus Peribacteraceae bacterium]